MQSLDRRTSFVDTQAMLRFVDDHPGADMTRMGAVGYCMSGPFVVWAGVDFAPRFAAIASIHGANMATDSDDSPHRVVAQLKCESYFACAEIDKWAPPADIDKLQAGLENGQGPHRIEWYAQAEHGFVFPLRAGIYKQEAAERHWERLFALFDKTLRR
jgi:carboxymethylenebutenolidase